MIRLIGPGGAGKSTAGTLLGRRLRVPFVDLDEQFAVRVGDISRFIDRHGYDAYARRNVDLYFRVASAAGPRTVVALSSGFMTYRLDVHSDYAHCRRDFSSSPTTFVLLPSLDVEVCVAEIVRRQTGRPFSRGAVKEEEVIRARFPVYAGLPAMKVETMRSVREVVDVLVATAVPADQPGIGTNSSMTLASTGGPCASLRS